MMAMLEVRGRVVGPDGAPIIGAEVVVKPHDREAETIHVATDTEGAFSVEVPPSPMSTTSVAWVNVLAPGFAIGGSHFVLPGDNVFRLEPAGEVRGRVVDEGGHPVAGARVVLFTVGREHLGPREHVSLLEEAQDRFATQTDHEGGWVIQGVPGAGTAGIALDDPRFPMHCVDASLGPDAIEPPPLLARPPAVIEGLVVREDGRTPVGIEVRADGPSHRALASADEGGRYRLARLPAGPYSVSARDASGEAVPSATSEVMVRTGETVTAPTITMVGGGFIEGEVTDQETGQPIAGAHVVVQAGHSPVAWSAVTSEGGRYRVRVAPGNVRVDARAPGYLDPVRPVTVTVRAGRSVRVTLPLPPALTSTGLAVDEEGRPVGAQVCFRQSGRQGAGYDQSLAVSPSGEFSLSVPAPGKYVVKGVAGWKVISPRQVELPSPEPLRLVVQRPQTGTLTARVVTPDDAPVPGARIVLRLAEYLARRSPVHAVVDRRAEVLTDRQGRFSVSFQGSPGFELRAEKEGYHFVAGGQAFRLGDGFQTTDLVMVPLAEGLEGRVVDGARRPLCGARVMSPQARSLNAVTTDEAGWFRLEGLPAGEVEVIAAEATAARVVRALIPGPEVVIELAPAAASPESDVLRGFAVLLEAWQAMADDSHREGLLGDLAPYDPELARRLALHLEDEPRRRALAGIAYRLAQQDPCLAAAWVPSHLDQIGEVASRVTAASVTALMAARERPEAARALVARAKQEMSRIPVPVGPVGEDEATDRGFAARAFLAAAMLAVSDPGGEALLHDVIAQVGALTPPEGPSEQDIHRFVIEIVARGNLEAARRAARAVELPEEDWRRTLATAAADIACSDPAGGLRLLQEAGPPSEAARWYDAAAVRVAGALASDDPTTALALARTVGDPERRSLALALVASHQPAAERATLFRQAANGVRGIPALVARIAAAAYYVDPALGTALFASTRAHLASTDKVDAEVAFHYRLIGPAESRVLLEAECARRAAIPAQSQEQDPAGAITALSALDVDRALTLARAAPEEARIRALRRIARYLAAPERVRRTLSLGAAGDWMPGFIGGG